MYFTSLVKLIPRYFIFYSFWCSCKWDCFLNFSFCYFIISIQKHNRFLYIILQPVTLLNSFISSHSFWRGLSGFLCIVLCHLQIDSFSSSLSIWMLFLSFSSLIALARTSSTMLNKSGQSGHPCLFPDLRGKLSAFHH